MKAIVTGSFDPITLGHLELIKYACEKYDQVYVVALVNEAKEYMFTMEQKKKLIELAVSDFKNAIADAYVGLTVDYMHNNGITHIIRGVRNEQDIEYEKILAEKMKEFDSSFKTEIIMCNAEYANISSTAVRKSLKSAENLEAFLPNKIISPIKQMYLENLSKQNI